MDNNIIPIITVSSTKFLKYALVMIWSVMRCANKNNVYVFYIFHNELTNQSMKWLREQLHGWKNCVIQFVDIDELEKKWVSNDVDWNGKAPCLSLFAVDYLSQYNKILALDVDLIVKKDVGILYEQEIGDALIGAVYDLDFIGQWMKGNKDYKAYYKESVPLNSPKQYIQSGVLLINLAEVRKKFPPGFLVQVAAKRKFRYDDQDIWNLYCSDRIVKLDYRWNVLHDNNSYRIRYIIDFAPKAEVLEYKKSRIMPFIIHYAGDQKPWNDVNCDFAEEFWYVAKQTPIYNMLLKEASANKTKQNKTFIHTFYYEMKRAYAKLCGILRQG